jgi:hypothetical protein
LADDSHDYNDDRPCRNRHGRSSSFNEVLRDQFSEPQEEAQPPLLDSRTAPGAAELVVMGHWAAAEEQLLAQSLSLTAPGAVVVVLMGHSAAAEEQLLAQSLSLTAPGAASLVLQQVPVVLQQESLETAPMVAESSFAWWLLQPASKLSRAAAARVVSVRVIVGNSSEGLIWPRSEASVVQWVPALMRGGPS